ncbi:ornithine--oxo-acid transaminase [Gammaproteobacteria bacterium]|jgi:ornithine--oxo-acid transaminase|nr:ornithine--oxo-acid transaminase [Gammaproteobacteria bacterium]MDA7819126.1 ornithine--oxo-acid transaminase [Gammaproteobacteria bacterium]MDA9113717.1 ornithine--oxo-acid transaminase [Gammaproteobacteria bacterium]MDA9221178.1 ornithine--oxo-acid transaminase [Gammaproteobacteria bacterium]MDB4156621.1 ornithine--oxo-acid transaminase [Gammaproteobacteria bacterium]
MKDTLQKDYFEKEAIYGASNYSPLPVVLEKGKGAYLWDIDGNKYLDMMSAYSAVSHGHSHPQLVQTLHDQATKLAISSRAFYTEPFAGYLEKLSNISGFEAILPMNTGAEAVETAIKAARRWGYFTKGIEENKAEIIVADGNFHGRTSTIVGFSSDAEYKKGFGPFGDGFATADYCSNCSCDTSNCIKSIDSIKKLINKNTCAVLVEPIQGEGGIIIPRDGWLKQLRDLCSENNVLMILDEIQSGLGRTGKLFAFQHEDIIPDGLILGKALGGGLIPVSAFLSSREVMNHFDPGSHGSTFGGNPLAAAVASKALDLLYEDNLIDNSHNLGLYFLNELKALDFTFIKEVRGKGLWIGLELINAPISAKNICKLLLKEGMLCKETHETVIRFAPPLMIQKSEIDWALEKIKKVFSSL